MPAYRAVLVDSAGNPVFDGYPQGGPVPASAWDNAMPVEVDGLTVGTLLVTGTSDGVLGVLEEGFLSRIRLALASIALMTLAAGLLLSVSFARSVSRPIERLAGAAADLASRRFGRKVDLLGQNVPVEVSGLVDSFNSMSDELAAAESARQELLRDISHEIRTPLTILSGNLEAVSTGAISLDAETLGTMTAEIERLSELVKGVDRLDRVSAVAEGAAEPVSPAEVVVRSAASIQGAAVAKGVRVDREVDGGLGDVVIYPDRVQQVFSNLLSNALRYTTEGGYIAIGARADRGETRDKAAVVFSVRDSGPGIPHDQLQKVFERFFRGDSSRARATGGSGLGLAIAKGLVEGWGGTIWAENSRDGGAIFSFTVPTAPRSQRSSSQSPML
jgi:signal transduction histidine kinase